jgi:hypothetical protein
MMRSGACLFAAALSAAIAATAAAQPKPSSAPPAPSHRSECFSLDFVDGISSDDRRVAYIRVGPSDMFKVDMMPGCLDLDWPMTPKKIISKTGREGDICDYTDLIIVVGHHRCFASGMHKMTPAEIEAWRHPPKPAKH